MTTHTSHRLTFASTLVVALGLPALAAAEGDSASKQQKQHKTSTDAHAITGDGSAKLSLTGTTRERVKEVQRQLAARNLYTGKIDGVVGSQTQKALENFQTQQGMSATGELDARTADALGLISSDRQPVSGSDHAPAMNGSQGQASSPIQRQMGAESTVPLSSISTEDGRKIQQRLQELGFYNGPIDGVLGQQTRGALSRYYQRQAQLASQGVLSEGAVDSFGVDASARQPTSGSEP